MSIETAGQRIAPNHPSGNHLGSNSVPRRLAYGRACIPPRAGEAISKCSKRHATGGVRPGTLPFQTRQSS
jgi:hypothetical protein